MALTKRQKAARKAAQTRRANQAAAAGGQFGGAAGTYGPALPNGQEYFREGNRIYWGRRANGKQSRRLPRMINGRVRDAAHTRNFRGCAHVEHVPGYWRCKGNSAAR